MLTNPIRRFRNSLTKSPGVFNVSFLFMSSNVWSNFHLRCIKESLNSSPKNAVLVVLRFFSWYFYYGWKNIYLIFKQRYIFINHINKTDKQLLVELIHLSIGLMVPAKDYLIMSLFRYPKNEWVDRIYDHESPQWQSVLSGKIDKSITDVINSKHKFFVEGKKRGLPVVETKGLVTITKSGDLEFLQQNEDIFLKLVESYQSKGSFKIWFNETLSQYCLLHEYDGEIIRGLESIKKYLGLNYMNKSFLIQDILENSKELVSLFGIKKLSLIKLVSVVTHTSIDILAAEIYTPLEEDKVDNLCLHINVETGKLNGFGFPEINNSMKEGALKYANVQIPQWEKIKAITCECHSFYNQAKIISTDIAIAQNNLTILELNLNPSLACIQNNVLIPLEQILN